MSRYTYNKQYSKQIAARNKNLIDAFLAGATITMLQTIHNLAEQDVLKVIREQIRTLRIEKAQEKRLMRSIALSRRLRESAEKMILVETSA